MYQAYPPFEDSEFVHVGGILRHFRDVQTFIFDVDGVLTNNEVLVMETGEQLRKMNIRDGYALKKAVQEGFQVMILTGGKSKGVLQRLKDLGVVDVVLDVDDKLATYKDFVAAYRLDESQILYMGDDVPDLEVMHRVGLPTCPKDAIPEALRLAQYVSPFKGGEGCVRDVIEKVLKLNGKW